MRTPRCGQPGRGCKVHLHVSCLHDHQFLFPALRLVELGPSARGLLLAPPPRSITLHYICRIANRRATAPTVSASVSERTPRTRRRARGQAWHGTGAPSTNCRAAELRQRVGQSAYGAGRAGRGRRTCTWRKCRDRTGPRRRARARPRATRTSHHATPLLTDATRARPLPSNAPDGTREPSRTGGRRALLFKRDRWPDRRRRGPRPAASGDGRPAPGRVF